MRSLIRLILVLSCAAATATAVFCLAACSGGEITGELETPAMTHDPVTLEVDGRPGTYHWHNFVDGKCTMCDETTIFEEQPVGDSDLIDRKSEYPGTLQKITYSTRSYIGEALYAENICCNVHYIPVYYFPYYQRLGYKKGICPNAETLYEEILTLPLFYGMTDQDVQDVIAAVEKVLRYFYKP